MKYKLAFLGIFLVLVLCGCGSGEPARATAVTSAPPEQVKVTADGESGTTTKSEVGTE